MTRLTLPRVLAWWAALAVLLVLIATPPSARAQQCEAVDQNDMPRDCTFLEEHGECLVSALDSYDGCIEDGDGFVDRIVCEAGVQIDLLACNLALPWTFLQSMT